MMTIADAAPGEEPQTAVVPGKTCQRVSSQPRPAAASTERTLIAQRGKRGGSGGVKGSV